MIYYASFTPGMQKVVEQIIRERLADVTIQKLLDGAVVFETQCSYDKLNFFCFINIFVVISIAEKPNPATALEVHMKAACTGGRNAIIAENNKKIQSFRIVSSRENKLVPVDERVKQETERYIAKQSGMRVDRQKPDTEFWFLYRNEGFSVFMKRLTKHGAAEKTLHPGELAPQLAYMLCWLSNPKHTDIVIDPFCGYGSIPEQRLKRFPLAQFYASDIDEKALAYARSKFTDKAQNYCYFIKTDIYELTALLPLEGADAIITDPPWGLYDPGAFGKSGGSHNSSIEQFYADMVNIFAELLKPGGTAVVLTAKQDELNAGVTKSGKFEITETLPILVSGKKACVFVLRKSG
jgi:tRNA G10  N-methylase Trm11